MYEDGSCCYQCDTSGDVSDVLTDVATLQLLVLTQSLVIDEICIETFLVIYGRGNFFQ